MFRREFEHEKRTGVKHVQYLIERCRDGVPVGWVFTHGHRPIDRYAFLCVYLAPGFRRLGYGVDAAALLSYELFTAHGLRKLYFDVYTFNDQSQSVLGGCTRGLGLRLEGRFVEHRYHDGKYWDQLRYALSIRELAPLEAYLRRRGIC